MLGMNNGQISIFDPRDHINSRLFFGDFPVPIGLLTGVDMFPEFLEITI